MCSFADVVSEVEVEPLNGNVPYTSDCYMCPVSWAWAHGIACEAVFSSVRIQCMIKHKGHNVVSFRFTSWRHPGCGAGGCTHLCPAGRSDVVCVQEERFTFPGASHSCQRILPTNQLTGYRVGWKCADHRPRGSLRRIALNDCFSIFFFFQCLTFSICLSPFHHQV